MSRTLQEGLRWPLSILGRSGDTMVLGLADDMRTWVSRSLGTLLRHHAGTRGLLLGSWDASAIPTVWVGVLGGRLAPTHWWSCCSVGTFRRHHGVGGHMSCIRIQHGTAWDALRYHAVGLVRAGMLKVNGTIVPVLLALFVVWTSSMPAKQSTTCGSKRSRSGVKGRCGVSGLQGRPGSGSPEAQHINGCPRDTSCHCEEAGEGRQGSPR